MHERRTFAYLRVNMQTRQVMQEYVFVSTLAEQPAEKAMNHFGPLKDDEELFVLVDSKWSHSFQRKH